MSNKTIFRAGNKYFLNLQGWQEDASVCYFIKVNQYGDKKRYNDCEIKIRDCEDTVRLNLSVSSKESLKNSLFKLDKMIAVLQAAKEDLKKARKVYKNGV